MTSREECGQLDFDSPVDPLGTGNGAEDSGFGRVHDSPRNLSRGTSANLPTSAEGSPTMDDEARGILSRLDELRFQSVKRGVYAEVARRMEARLEDGEPVSGAWIMETTKAVQVQYDLVPLP